MYKVSTQKVLIVAAFAIAHAAAAHNMFLHAYVEGNRIAGGVSFGHHDDAAANVTVEVFGPEGDLLDSVTTDAQGRFEYEPQSRVTHTFVVQTPDGHRAEYTVPADELPPSLDGAKGQQATAGSESKLEAPHPRLDEEKLRAMLDESLGRHMNALREQLHAHDSRVQFRDVVGAIGYIAGLAGLVMYIKARNSTKKG